MANPNPAVYSRGFDFAYYTSHPTQTQLNSDDPDIIVLAYPMSFSGSSGQANANMYKSYLNNGGVLVAMLENAGIEMLLRTVLGDNSINSYSAGTTGSVYMITNTVDDAIVNGPFGDLCGLQWGEDASPTEAVNNLPSNVTVYSSVVDISGNAQWPSNGTPYVNAFRYHALPFVFIGDGGAISSEINTSSLFTIHSCCQYHNLGNHTDSIRQRHLK